MRAYLKKSTSKIIETNEADVVLRLMFEIAISDGSLDKAELELIKEQVRAVIQMKKFRKLLRESLMKPRTQFPFIHRSKKLMKLIQLKKKRSCFQSYGI